MRQEPVKSVRQSRLESTSKNVTTSRQADEVRLSERQRKGFENNAKAIARRQGISYDRAAAILAASSRRASAAAKKKNPRLKKVKGKAS